MLSMMSCGSITDCLRCWGAPKNNCSSVRLALDAHSTWHVQDIAMGKTWKHWTNFPFWAKALEHQTWDEELIRCMWKKLEANKLTCRCVEMCSQATQKMTRASAASNLACKPSDRKSALGPIPHRTVAAHVGLELAFSVRQGKPNRFLSLRQPGTFNIHATRIWFWDVLRYFAVYLYSIIAIWLWYDYAWGSTNVQSRVGMRSWLRRQILRTSFVTSTSRALAVMFSL